MAQVRRNDIEQGDPALGRSPVEHGYTAGGHVAQLQADLALRLADEGIAWAPAVSPSPVEQWVRRVSIAGGYAALAAGYAVAAMAVARWA